jgi:hypothetical protein
MADGNLAVAGEEEAGRSDAERASDLWDRFSRSETSLLHVSLLLNTLIELHSKASDGGRENTAAFDQMWPQIEACQAKLDEARRILYRG